MRKVHSLLLLPGLEAAETFSRQMEPQALQPGETEGLNERQREAVERVGRSVAVIAGPGAGKCMEDSAHDKEHNFAGAERSRGMAPAQALISAPCREMCPGSGMRLRMALQIFRGKRGGTGIGHRPERKDDSGGPAAKRPRAESTWSAA